MFPFKCPKCSRISILTEKPRCLYCADDPATDTGMDENVHPKQSEIATLRDTGEGCGSRNHMFSDEMQTNSTVVAQSRKRKESNDRMLKNVQANKQCRQETCKKVGRNTNFMPETNTTTIPRAIGNNHLVNIRHEFLKVEESHPLNRGMSKIDNFGKTIPVVVSQNLASNIGDFQSSRNDNASRKILDSIVSTKIIVRSVDNILAIPGPSGFIENVPNFCREIFQSNNSPVIQSIVQRSVETLTCRVCKAKISDHADKKIGNLYNCCVCEYNNCGKINLVIHSYDHCPIKACNFCTREYTGDSHESEHICIVCEKTYQCRTKLDEHSLDHGDYFLDHCRCCYKLFNDHFAKMGRKTIYVCCVCKTSHSSKENRISHYHEHIPKLFCETCREEYPDTEKDLHNREHKCIVCQRKFQCKTLLEDHSIDHEKHFDTYCMVCNKEIANGHEIDGDFIYNCCVCPRYFNYQRQLKKHLDSHVGIRFFKCDICGKRFHQKNNLDEHHDSCPAVPFRCERCAARFPTSHFLDLHCSVKHRKTR